MSRGVLLALGWGWAAAIAWLSLMPDAPQVDFEQSDKLGHLLGYGLLMALFCLAYEDTKNRVGYAAGFVAMGIALEFAQGALGYRRFELLDMAANALGVLGGWALAALAHRIRLP